MLDTITASPAPTHGTHRSLVDRDEYGPLGACAGGLFSAPVVPRPLLAERDEFGHRLGAWVPEADLL